MDWNNMQTWHYCAIGAASVLVLGLILYFLPVGKLKVPSVVTTAFAALGLGLALGVVFMAGFGYKPFNPEGDGGGGGGGNPDGDGKGSPPKLKMGPGGMPKGPGGPGGGGPPSPRVQLAALVGALDNVVDKPISVTLTAEERAAIAEQLKGLDAQAEVKDEDAKARLDAILKVIEKDRKSLETVGYRWPGAPSAKGGFGGGAKDSPNPFKEGATHDRLKSLLDRLEKK